MATLGNKMNKRSSTIRIILGVVIAPWLYIVVWTLPVLEHSAFHKWVVINTFFAYIVFLVLAGMSHLLLAKFRATKIWSYCAIMFVVAFSMDVLLSLWSLSGFTSNYYAQTQVVEDGSITAAGYILQIQEALINGVVSAGVMAIFWFAAIYNSKGGAKFA